MKRVFINLAIVAGLFATIALGSAFVDEPQKNEHLPLSEVSTYADLELPKVFLIGEYIEEFDLASAEYKLQLLEACEQDMHRAYFKWLSMLQEMENYADALEFDIKGVKMWIKVFWSPEGDIDHIAYYLKPNSKNVNVDELTAFFSSFIKQYKFPLTTDAKFSNYGSASFPVVSKRKTAESN